MMIADYAISVIMQLFTVGTISMSFELSKEIITQNVITQNFSFHEYIQNTRRCTSYNKVL